VTEATTCAADWLTACQNLESYYRPAALEVIVNCERAAGWPIFCPSSGDAGNDFDQCLITASNQLALPSAATRFISDICADCLDEASAPFSCSDFSRNMGADLSAFSDTSLETLDRACTGAALASFDAGSAGSCVDSFMACYPAVMAAFPSTLPLFKPPATCFGGVNCLDAAPNARSCGSEQALDDGGTRRVDCTCGGACLCSVNGSATSTYYSNTACDLAPAVPPSPNNDCPL
jgi:hypothetical protein